MYTLDIYDKFMHNVHKPHELGKNSDQQGKHSNRMVDQHTVDGIHQHIKSFKTIPTHYCWQTTDRHYLPHELVFKPNIKRMYRMYQEYCIENGFVVPKESMYRRVFNSDYKISFQARKKDQCNYCVAFENSPKIDQQQKRIEYKII